MADTELTGRVAATERVLAELMENAATSAASLLVVEETLREILDAMPRSAHQAIVARVSDRIGGLSTGSLAARAEAALERLFGPAPPRPPRH